MKKMLLPLFILGLILSSCNHHPTDESQETSRDSGAVDLTSVGGGDDSIVLKEPITSWTKHYFSDSVSKDSFVMEAPAGNISKQSLYIKIYSSKNALLFIDSMSPSDFFDDEVYSQGNAQAEVAINDLRRGIAAFFTGDDFDNFSTSGNELAIKNAKGKQITDMAGWTEAVDDSNKIVFTFFESYRGTSFVTYSPKLKKAVTIVQIAEQQED
jgi:hypothetical protein